jgi:hypothetical protein
MVFNDQLALQKIWLFSNSGRALALPVTDAAVCLAPSGRQRSDFMSIVEDAALDKRVYARVAEQDQRRTIIITARIARDLPSLRELVDR